MAVLVEGISVVIKAEAINQKYPGGWKEFQAHPPNRTVCSDGELVRVGFMAPEDTETFVDRLEAHGILYLRDDITIDLVVADQQNGLLAECDWACTFRTDLDGDPQKPVTGCELIGSKLEELVTPDGWVYEKSLSANFTFLEMDKVPGRMELLRREADVDVYRDLQTGKEVFVGRYKDGTARRDS